MYSFITHPSTKKIYPIFSNTGKYILKLYISNLYAGSYNDIKLDDIENKVKFELKNYLTLSIEQGYPGVYVTPAANSDGSLAPSWDLLSKKLEIIPKKISKFKLSDFIKKNDNIFQIKYNGPIKESNKYITFSDMENLKNYLFSLKINVVNPHSEDKPYISEEDIQNLINQDIDKEALNLCNIEHLKESGISEEKAIHILNQIIENKKKKKNPLYKR